jgi:HicB family
MKRMNLRDVPDDVYAELVEAAAESRQSLNAYVVDRLVEVARTSRLRDYVASYTPPAGTGITLDDVVEAVREGRREAS